MKTVSYPTNYHRPAARLRNAKLWLYYIIILIALAGLTTCGSTAGGPLVPGAETREVLATAFTTRLPGMAPEQLAVSISQAVYPATREENAPGAIIVCPQIPALAFTAMNRITHMPINAPLLYLTTDNTLGAETVTEMRRLKPEGVTFDGNIQVYLLGEAGEAVARIIDAELGYKVRYFATNNPLELAELLDRWQAAIKADHPDEVVVSALDYPDGMWHGIGAMGWNAHMGRGFAWVFRDEVPVETRKILERRLGEAYIYLTGGPEVISTQVASELSRYGPVRRVFGRTIYQSNTVNAGYKDFGRNFGWWWGWIPRNFDWGIAQAGHNFIIISDNNLLGGIPAALLGHMGKHGPILVVRPDEVPQSVVDYLEMVRPFITDPLVSIRNHGWIIGSESLISWNVQKQIHTLLRPYELNTEEE